MSEERCWICLGDDGDPPPLSQAGESCELITACSCSLRAHKRCLLDWALDTGFKTRTANFIPNVAAEGPTNGQFMEQRGDQIAFGMTAGWGVIGIRNLRGRRILTNDRVKCPQCQRWILISMKPSWILRSWKEVTDVGSEIAKYSVLGVLGSSMGLTLSISILAVLVAGGKQLWNVVCPESVLMKLLNLQEKSFNSALKNDSIHLGHLGLLATFPFLLVSLNSSSPYLILSEAVYPLTFYSSPWAKAVYGPKHFLSLLVLSKNIYRIVTKVTLNRLYYRWVQLIKPCFLADRLPLEELENIEKENAQLQEIHSKPEKLTNNAWYTRIWRWLFPSYTQEEKDIMDRRKSRETRAIMTVDYAKVFHKHPPFWNLVSAVLWPILGSLVGEVLSDFTNINGILAPYVKTPDEGTYARNLIGMLAVTIMKDLIKLYLAWTEVAQYKNIDVVDAKFSGFDATEFITQYTNGNFSTPQQVLQYHNQRNEPARRNILG